MPGVLTSPVQRGVNHHIWGSHGIIPGGFQTAFQAIHSAQRYAEHEARPFGRTIFAQDSLGPHLGIQEGGSAAKSLDASLDLAVQAAASRAASLDLAVQQALTALASLDLAVFTPGAKTPQIDIAVQAAETALASLDMAIQVALSAPAVLDLVVQVPQAAVAQLDLAVREAIALAADLDLAVQAPVTLLANLDLFVDDGTPPAPSGAEFTGMIADAGRLMTVS